MRTIIFYFSATGNCLTVAKDIAKGLPEATTRSIPEVIQGEIDLDADNIGIVFPVFFAGIPRIISDFVKKLDAGRIKYIFAVGTNGGFSVDALLILQEQLRDRGIILNAGYYVQMPGNYIVNYGAYPEKRQDKIFRKEAAAVQEIIHDIENQNNKEIKKNNFLISRIGNMAYRTKYEQFPILDKNFEASDKCNGCRTCQKICPVNNIRIQEKKPEWLGNCEHCMACIQWCPQEAIEYASRTSGRKRYRHPDVKAEDLFMGS